MITNDMKEVIKHSLNYSAERLIEFLENNWEEFEDATNPLLHSNYVEDGRYLLKVTIEKNELFEAEV